MLYIPINSKILVNVPRISANITNITAIRLTSTIDLAPIEVAVKVIDVTDRYIALSATIPVLPVGEYRYDLLNGGESVSHGIAILKSDNETYRQNEYKEEYYQYSE